MPGAPAAVPPISSSRPFTHLSWVVCWVCLAAAYATTGHLCVRISEQVATQVGNVSWLFYIPAGLSLSAALMWGAWVWPGVFLGEFLMSMTSSQGPGVTTHQLILMSVVMAAGNALDAALVGWFFHDRPKRRIEFDRLRDVIALIGAELILLQPMGALIGLAAVSIGSPIPKGMMLSTFVAWYTANLFAQFVMAPICLVWTQRNRVKRRVRPVELLAAIVVTLLVGALGPGRWATHSLPLPVTFVLIFPLLVWCAVRFPPSVAISVGTVLGFFAFDAAMAEAGPFASILPEERMLYLNGFMAVTIATSLFLAGAMGDSVRFETEQERLIKDLKDALHQVERLKDLVTFCAWTGRVRWNGQWVSVEHFLRERYQVHITHGISEEAMDLVLAEAERQRKLAEEGHIRPPGSSDSPFTSPPPPPTS